MSNKPSRGIGITHMEEILILGNMAWKSLGIGIQFHMGYQSLSLFYFIFNCIKYLLFLLCKFALISSQFQSFFLFFLHVLICMVLISCYSFISTKNQINKHLWDGVLQCIINGKLKDDHLLHYDKMFNEDKNFYKKIKGWKHNQRSQECQGKSPFPRTTYDMCHFCVGL